MRQPEETSRTCWRCGLSKREEWFNKDGLCLDCVKAEREGAE